MAFLGGALNNLHIPSIGGMKKQFSKVSAQHILHQTSVSPSHPFIISPCRHLIMYFCHHPIMYFCHHLIMYFCHHLIVYLYQHNIKYLCHHSQLLSKVKRFLSPCHPSPSSQAAHFAISSLILLPLFQKLSSSILLTLPIPPFPP